MGALCLVAVPVVLALPRAGAMLRIPMRRLFVFSLGRSRTIRAIVGMVLAATAGACGEALGPDRGNPAQYAFTDSVRFSCGGWKPGPPTVALGLFDIPGGLDTILTNLDTLAELQVQARERLVQRLLALDGTIVRKYNLLMVRAILPVARVPELGGDATVYGVIRSELKQDTFRVFVGFRDGIFPAVIEARGGTILQAYGALDAVLALLPDPAVPAVQRDPSVRFVEHALEYDCLI